MMCSHAPRARLSAGACAVLLAALATTAEARDTRRSHPQPIIEDLAAPTRGGFDDIVVQLPPLAPAPRKSERPAPAASADETARAVEALPPAEQPRQPQATTAEPVTAPPGEPQRVEAAPEPQELGAPAASSAAKAPEPSAVALSAAAPPDAAAKRDPAPTELAAPEATPPVELRRGDPVEPAPSATSPDASSQQPAIVDSAPSEQPPAAEATKPESAQRVAAVETQEEGSIFETWQLLVAALALGGLLVLRRRQAKASAGPAENSPAAAPTSARARALLVSLRGAWSKIAPHLSARAQAVVSRLRRKGRDGDSVRAEPDVSPASAERAERRLSSAHWADIAASLRAKFARPAQPSSEGRSGEGERAGGAPAARRAAAASPDADQWSGADQDVPELLEPGASSTHAIVMNARRKFRAAQG